jgi:ubiquitin-protein ligase
MQSVRDRRLESDWEKVNQLAQHSGGTIRIVSTSGRPPHSYVITFRCRGIERVNQHRPVFRDEHTLRIQFPAAYPSPAGRPVVSFVTPIFHPHVFPNQNVCLGSTLVGEYLDSLVLRLGALIQCDPKYFDFNSPANREAAEWARQNLSLFPLGHCSFVEKENSRSEVEWTDLR